jgi:ribosomal protein L10
MGEQGKSPIFKSMVQGLTVHLRRRFLSSPSHRLLPYIRGNVGFVFTKEDLADIREALLKNKVQAPARAGGIAPCDVVIPAQNTGLGPEKTSFFQALSIPTKISKGTIEIIVSFNSPSVPYLNLVCTNRTLRSGTEKKKKPFCSSFSPRTTST